MSYSNSERLDIHESNKLLLGLGAMIDMVKTERLSSDTGEKLYDIPGIKLANRPDLQNLVPYFRSSLVERFDKYHDFGDETDGFEDGFFIAASLLTDDISNITPEMVIIKAVDLLENRDLRVLQWYGDGEFPNIIPSNRTDLQGLTDEIQLVLSENEYGSEFSCIRDGFMDGFLVASTIFTDKH